MASAASMVESWAGVAQRNDTQESFLEQQDAMLAAIEIELQGAEAAIQLAEARYSQACLRVAKELAKSLECETQEPAECHKGCTEEMPPAEEHSEVAHELKQRVSHAPKNASALPDKVVSSQRWLAARASEGRARAAAKRARETLRRHQRDSKLLPAEVELETSPKEPRSTSSQPKEVSKAKQTTQEQAEVQKGAFSIAARLKGLQESDLQDKHTPLVKILTCGRVNFYSFEPADVVQDLKTQGLLDAVQATGLQTLLKTSPEKKLLLQAAWLARAKQMRTCELYDVAFTVVEAQYLGRLDGRALEASEAELEAAEGQLEAAAQQAEMTTAYYAQACETEARSNFLQKGDADLDHELEIEKWTRQQSGASERASHGLKNASALPEKVLSKERWLAERRSEERMRVAEKRGRDLQRSSDRDRKLEQADLPAGVRLADGGC
eukprot:CAMPEP_0197654088 /NCGR_PEP_ID=MMETSP1338-20131121/38642_1 /TAXON_ID=43686 ORGANISM="Pelagodinium beii, Strain RCC1491" /NCGR_SAMPLE_ID=MMETSP1338 /ASSEMBLY_ACC=CAM_ASM_000754 /LENGTH=438 /DNA_ID=CAMNT_0043229473 /DNA_START=69 /DNA_END=1385 /DNA_ORIENTATION=-